MTDIDVALGGSGGPMAVMSPRDPEQPANPEEKKFTIGELSREFGVTLRALRFYESKGLLAPHRRGSTRLYTSADRDSIGQILAGKRLGFTLVEIRRMVAERRGSGELQLSREKCLEQIALLEEQKRGIEAAIAELKTIHEKLAADAVEPSARTR